MMARCAWVGGLFSNPKFLSYINAGCAVRTMVRVTHPTTNIQPMNFLRHLFHTGKIALVTY